MNRQPLHDVKMHGTNAITKCLPVLQEFALSSSRFMSRDVAGLFAPFTTKSASLILARMAELGFVEWVSIDSDNRFKVYTLTDAGRTWGRGARPMYCPPGAINPQGPQEPFEAKARHHATLRAHGWTATEQIPTSKGEVTTWYVVRRWTKPGETEIAERCGREHLAEFAAKVAEVEHRAKVQADIEAERALGIGQYWECPIGDRHVDGVCVEDGCECPSRGEPCP